MAPEHTRSQDSWPLVCIYLLCARGENAPLAAVWQPARCPSVGGGVGWRQMAGCASGVDFPSCFCRGWTGQAVQLTAYPVQPTLCGQEVTGSSLLSQRHNGGDESRGSQHGYRMKKCLSPVFFFSSTGTGETGMQAPAKEGWWPFTSHADFNISIFGVLLWISNLLFLSCYRHFMHLGTLLLYLIRFLKWLPYIQKYVIKHKKIIGICLSN